METNTKLQHQLSTKNQQYDDQEIGVKIEDLKQVQILREQNFKNNSMNNHKMFPNGKGIIYNHVQM